MRQQVRAVPEGGGFAPLSCWEEWDGAGAPGLTAFRGARLSRAPVPARAVTKTQGGSSPASWKLLWTRAQEFSLLPPETPSVASTTARKEYFFYSIKQRLQCMVSHGMDPADSPSDI